ncbi:MAG: tetratricopeptide repeat protein [Verrucomicrobia bacterium]|nr:tetratricopeptide repeat protein [Verrucomicrobiota bacterium]
MVGIIEEQHPDRARLFMQWKQMKWPILVDSLNLLGVESVPITLAVDEYGIVRKVGIPLREARAFAQEFVAQTYDPPPPPRAPQSPARPSFEQLRERTAANTAEAWRDLADGLAVWELPNRLDESIGAYEKAIELSPQDARTRFGLGVAYRKRFDSDARQDSDFQRAVEHWKQALDLNPNQYIWRRRIQQYGPRLDKPYSFYDWVTAARREIIARGETPAALVVEPSGAEFAHPAKTFEARLATIEEPDPRGQILRDNAELIEIEVTTVPPVIKSGASARLHVAFRPNLRNKAHWNNEAKGLVLWLNPPPGWLVESRAISLENPPRATSREIRRLEFEIKSPAGAKAEPVDIPGYALYYVCEDVNGACLYRRQDVSLRVSVK